MKSLLLSKGVSVFRVDKVATQLLAIEWEMDIFSKSR